MIFRIGIIQFLNLQTFCQCRFHISDMSQCIGADDTVCHYSAAGILQCNDFAAQHIGFHLIPDSAAAAAFCDGDTAHIHTGTAVQVCNFHIIIADGLQYRMPESSLICIQCHIKETACGLFHIIGAARQIWQE